MSPFLFLEVEPNHLLTFTVLFLIHVNSQLFSNAEVANQSEAPEPRVGHACSNAFMQSVDP